tara:strand:- start:894 stop:1610 length:717 start_codon:yes stop_codon:yes gene_type:complete
MEQSISLSAIVPFFNEQQNLEESVKRLIKEAIFNKIVLVNDASEDSSLEIAKTIEKKHNHVQLISLDKNQGKGNAVHEGLKFINTSHVIVHDADLEYFPSDIVKMYKIAKQNVDSLVLGSRTISGQDRINKYKITYLGNKYLTLLFSILNNYKVSDIASCYWLLRTKTLMEMNLVEKGFGIEVEVLSKFVRNSKSIIEVPIKYHGRTYEEGKKIKLSDGINIVLKILKYSKFGNYFSR